jgi:hypothetical protein
MVSKHEPYDSLKKYTDEQLQEIWDRQAPFYKAEKTKFVPLLRVDETRTFTRKYKDLKKDRKSKSRTTEIPIIAMNQRRLDEEARVIGDISPFEPRKFGKGKVLDTRMQKQTGAALEQLEKKRKANYLLAYQQLAEDQSTAEDIRKLEHPPVATGEPVPIISEVIRRYKIQKKIPDIKPLHPNQYTDIARQDRITFQINYGAPSEKRIVRGKPKIIQNDLLIFSPEVHKSIQTELVRVANIRENAIQKRMAGAERRLASEIEPQIRTVLKEEGLSGAQIEDALAKLPQIRVGSGRATTKLRGKKEPRLINLVDGLQTW